MQKSHSCCCRVHWCNSKVQCQKNICFYISNIFDYLDNKYGIMLVFHQLQYDFSYPSHQIGVLILNNLKPNIYQLHANYLLCWQWFYLIPKLVIPLPVQYSKANKFFCWVDVKGSYPSYRTGGLCGLSVLFSYLKIFSNSVGKALASTRTCLPAGNIHVCKDCCSASRSFVVQYSHLVWGCFRGGKIPEVLNGTPVSFLLLELLSQLFLQAGKEKGNTFLGVP